MGKRLLVLIIFFAFSSLKCFSQIIDQDDHLRQIIIRDGQAEVTIPFSGVKSIDKLTKNVSILDVRNNIIHISLSPITVEWFIAQNYNYLLAERMQPKGLASAMSLNQALQWDSYPTYTQYDSIMMSFQKQYPLLCRLDTIGTTINGKLVLALKISHNATSDEDEPRVFYTSSMHGDETGGYVLMLHLADYLLKNYTVSNRVRNLVDNLEIWINPLANPDGTYGTGNIMSSPTRYNANGYDLNRNFPDPITPNTVKQKETLDMIRFMRKHKFSLSANFHSGSEVVNYPWDRWLSKIHADDSWFNTISRAYADTAHIYAGPAYLNYLDNGVTRGAAWYIVYGGRQDFMTWDLHGREVTIELDDQYITPTAQLSLLWQNNWHSLIGYLENALYGVHGLVRNKKTQAPVPAKVYISGHDVDSSQVYSDTLTGSFYRYLSPGSWNITFSADGYRDTTISNIIVGKGQKTDLIVDMSLLPTGIEKAFSSNSIVLYPDPANDFINAKLPGNLDGLITVRIINQSGQTVAQYNTEVAQGTPLAIDIGHLPSGMYTAFFSDVIHRRYCRGIFMVIK